MIIYCAGGHKKEYRDLVSKTELGKLFSFLYDVNHLENNKYKHLMMDSGAHSYNKDSINKIGATSKRKSLPPPLEYLKKYRNFILQTDSKAVFVELDAYGVIPIKILDKEYELLKNKNYIRVYHPIIDKGDLSAISKWIKEGQKYIGIGNDSRPYLNKIFFLTKNKIKVHGFAMVDKVLLEKYPFYSVDSMTPLMSVMYRGAIVNGKTKTSTGLIKSKDKEYFLSNITRMKQIINNFEKLQKYYTDLWTKRGVNWDE